MSQKYDFLVVGAGTFGATFARYMADHGRRCLVIDKREHVAGNVYTENRHGINVHVYGAHIFHTESEEIWEFVNQFAEWRPFVNNPRVRVGKQVYSFPINLFTLHQLWGVTTPAEARAKLAEVCEPIANPQSAEEWLLANVGRELYELFFEGYTKKQWFKHPRDLPASIVKRLPVRLTYNDGYFGVKYQAIPVGGYTAIYDAMLDGIDVELGVDLFAIDWRKYAKHLVFTGPIDRFFDYEHGRLEYRSLRFEFEVHDGDFQGHAVFNYPEESIPYLRTIEHKHFEQAGPKHYARNPGNAPEKTVVSYDYPIPPEDQANVEDPQYPIRDERNTAVYDRYRNIARGLPDVLFGGRLGEYRYYDIDQAMGSALAKARSLVEDRPKTIPAPKFLQRGARAKSRRE